MVAQPKLIYTRNLAVARIANRTGCQWPSRSSKIDDFYVIWKGIYHFLLVIKIITLALSLTVSEIQQLIAWNILFKISAKPLKMKTWLLLTTYIKSPAPYSMVPTPTPSTHRLATIPHDWHTIVRYDPSRSSKVNNFYAIWKPICNFLSVIYSNLGPILHNLATIHLWQTDRRQPYQ